MTKRKTYAEFVERYGRHFWPIRETSGGHRDGHRDGECYYNAALLVLCTSREPLVFVEGIGHAWAVDRQGRVIDPSMPEMYVNELAEESYFGVPYDKRWLRKIVNRWGGFADDQGGLMPSLEFLVFQPNGWRALAAGRSRATFTE
jgi:hypothetical protein